MSWLTPLNPPQTEWRGKSVWIIGASSGIGRATASALHAQGAQVTVSARSLDALESFVKEHPGSTVVPLDCTDRAAVHACTQQVQTQALPDCVLYCAGHYKAMRADGIDIEDMRRHMAVTFDGAFYLLEALLPDRNEAAS